VIDGIIINYGTYEKRYVFTNAPITTPDEKEWQPIIGKPPQLEINEMEKRQELTVALNVDTVRDELSWLTGRVGGMEVTFADVSSSGWSPLFRGKVTKWTVDTHYLTLTVESIMAAGLRTANRVRLSAGCIRLLGDRGCGVLIANYRVSGIISHISGFQVTVDVTFSGPSVPSPIPDNFFQFGYIDARGEVRMVMASTGTTLTLKFPLKRAEVGDPCTVYPGCDKTLDTCQNKFNNKENFLGFPYTPLEDMVFRGKTGEIETGGGSS